jgi:hypothetical protein
MPDVYSGINCRNAQLLFQGRLEPPQLMEITQLPDLRIVLMRAMRCFLRWRFSLNERSFQTTGLIMLILAECPVTYGLTF